MLEYWHNGFRTIQYSRAFPPAHLPVGIQGEVD